MPGDQRVPVVVGVLARGAGRTEPSVCRPCRRCGRDVLVTASMLRRVAAAHDVAAEFSCDRCVGALTGSVKGPVSVAPASDEQVAEIAAITGRSFAATRVAVDRALDQWREGSNGAI